MTGMQIIKILPQLLQSTHRSQFSTVLRYLQNTMSIYLQRLVDSDDHAHHYPGRVLWDGVLEPIVDPLLQRLYSVSNEASNYSNSTKALVLNGLDLLEERMNTLKFHRTQRLLIPTIVEHWHGVAMDF